MKKKRILSVILIVLGVGLFIIGSYISSEVAQGRKKISGAQRSVDQGKELTQISPFTKDIGDMAAGSVQGKIDEGSRTADNYELLANWLHGTGVVIFIAGIFLLVFTFVRKKSS